MFAGSGHVNVVLLGLTNKKYCLKQTYKISLYIIIMHLEQVFFFFSWVFPPPSIGFSNSTLYKTLKPLNCFHLFLSEMRIENWYFWVGFIWEILIITLNMLLICFLLSQLVVLLFSLSTKWRCYYFSFVYRSGLFFF